MKNFLFEGTEKKIEIIFSHDVPSLRKMGDAFWKKICKKAHTHIVSSLSDACCDSYILSESSLFVWDHRLLMLTCGNSSLMNSLLTLLKHFGQDAIELLFYQRKNEFFPRQQKSSFQDDVRKLQKIVEGKSYCFGKPDEHHFYLFHSTWKSQQNHPDRTIEILMYDVEEDVKKIFKHTQPERHIKNHLNLDRIFKNGAVDDFSFQPKGYSLNAIKADMQYYTIHATPQEPCFYVSFETNIQEQTTENVLNWVINTFKPKHFDSNVFSNYSDGARKIVPDGFMCTSHFYKQLECGYEVNFASFVRPSKNPRPPFELS